MPGSTSSSWTSSATSDCPTGAAELVFQVLSERHERASLIVTTNLPFGEWTKVFPDARLAKAVVDRLTHRAHIIDTGTESWRFRHGLANPED
jgi:DNA replication protein DnaC